MTILIPVLGDQLSHTLSSLTGVDPGEAVILMAEVVEEASYVRHHKAKLAYIFSAMRHHAEDLRAHGWQVDYTTLDNPDNAGSLTGELLRAVERHQPSAVRVTEAGEWRVAAMIDGWGQMLDIDVAVLPDDRFLASHAEFDAWAADKKSLRMEFFYRLMRRKTGLLMDGDQPAGGKWNYDTENRGRARREDLGAQPLAFAPDAITQDCIDLVAARFPDNIGRLDGFVLGATRADAEAQTAHFMANALPKFGDFQDAMLTGEPYLYHAIISPYLNSGLLDPLDLCRRAEVEYREGRAPLNAVEGFIRQIIGWREYVRGIYWREGPDYTRRNVLRARRDLPEFYWTGDTDMRCMAEVIGATIDHAYAHHIQRLMVTGNFALLAGIDPYQVHEWYLEVYADAYEWVEAPNVIGMSQFADGGILASKPYASSGAYINRMSDYCQNCRYDVSKRVGADACPFNALYWHFMDRHRDRFETNPRTAMPYRNWDRMAEDTRAEILGQADAFLAKLEAGA